MKKAIILFTACGLLHIAPAQAASLAPVGHITRNLDFRTFDSGAKTSALVWQAKNDKAKGNGKPKKAKKDKQAGKSDKKPKEAPGQAKKQDAKAPPGQARKDNPERTAHSPQDRAERVERMMRSEAPAGRDMRNLAATAGLLALAPGLVLSDIPEDDVIAYRNCPPGLLKKDPPCVPPGLAKKGVTYEEWAGYGQEDWDRLWLDRRSGWLDTDVRPDRDSLLLQSSEIAQLFGLPAAPIGQRYAVIDGMPVLLDEEDYTSLLLVNELAQVTQVDPLTTISPTAALTQSDLQRFYRLPPLGPDENYAVLNGQIVRLSDSQYETLQLIRIARAIL